MLCCKEVSSTKSKEKKDKTRSQGPKIRNRNAKLQLKGRIFMTNVTDIVSLSKPGKVSSKYPKVDRRLTAAQDPTAFRFGGRGTPVLRTSPSSLSTKIL